MEFLCKKVDFFIIYIMHRKTILPYLQYAILLYRPYIGKKQEKPPDRAARCGAMASHCEIVRYADLFPPFRFASEAERDAKRPVPQPKKKDADWRPFSLYRGYEKDIFVVP